MASPLDQTLGSKGISPTKSTDGISNATIMKRGSVSEDLSTKPKETGTIPKSTILETEQILLTVTNPNPVNVAKSKPTMLELLSGFESGKSSEPVTVDNILDSFDPEKTTGKNKGVKTAIFDPGIGPKFFQFSKREFSSENTGFILDMKEIMTELKNDTPPRTDEQKVEFLKSNICDKFIGPKALYQINLPGHVNKEIAEALSTKDLGKLLSGLNLASSKIIELVRTDTLPRFNTQQAIISITDSIKGLDITEQKAHLESMINGTQEVSLVGTTKENITTEAQKMLDEVKEKVAKTNVSDLIKDLTIFEQKAKLEKIIDGSQKTTTHGTDKENITIEAQKMLSDINDTIAKFKPEIETALSKVSVGRNQIVALDKIINDPKSPPEKAAVAASMKKEMLGTFITNDFSLTDSAKMDQFIKDFNKGTSNMFGFTRNKDMIKVNDALKQLQKLVKADPSNDNPVHVAKKYEAMEQLKDACANFLITDQGKTEDTGKVKSTKFDQVNALFNKINTVEKNPVETTHNKKYASSLDEKVEKFNARKVELTRQIDQLTQMLDINVNKDTPQYKEGNSLLFLLKNELKGIDDQLSKISIYKKSGVTAESVKGYQSAYAKQNLYQKVLATEVTEKDQNGTMLNSDELGILPSFKPKLKEVGDWGKIKEEFIKNPEKMSMRDITIYRKAYVDQLVSELVMKHEAILNQENTNPNEYIKLKINVNAFGSANLTSDYDVTIASVEVMRFDKRTDKPIPDGSIVDHKLEQTILQEFNHEFRKEWKSEGGTAFDTNLYSLGFQLGNELRNIPMDPKNQKIDDLNQDACALVKQRIHMGESDWNDFVSETLKGIPEGPKRETAKLQYEKANTYAITRQNELNREIVSIHKSDVNLSTKNDKEIEELANEVLNNSPNKDDVIAQASNRLYEKKLILVEEKIRSGKDLTGPEKEAHTVELDKLKSEALFFANEPYFSKGPLRHVVGNLQKFKDQPPEKQYEISKSQAMQSLNENFGDTMKDFHHYGDDDFGKLAYKASKYSSRIGKAIESAIGNPQIDPNIMITIPVTDSSGIVTQKQFSLADIVKDLNNINKPLLEIRGGTNPNIPTGEENKFAKEQFSSEKGIATLEPFTNLAKMEEPTEAYKKILIAIVSQVNIIHRSSDI